MGKLLNQGVGVFEANKAVTGMFLGVSPFLDENGNQLKSRTYGTDLFIVTMADPKTGETRDYFADGGLRGAIKMSRLKKEQLVSIVWTGEHKKIEDGEVKVYEIRDASNS